MSNVVKIKKHTMEEEIIALERILSMAESLALLAKTPEQAKRLNARVEKIRAAVQNHKERAERLDKF